MNTNGEVIDNMTADTVLSNDGLLNHKYSSLTTSNSTISQAVIIKYYLYITMHFHNTKISQMEWNATETFKT